MLWRIHVQADNVNGLFLKTWIVGGHVAVQSMRLQPGFGPPALPGGFAQAEHFRQFSTRPVSGTIAGFLLRLTRDPGLHFRVCYARLAVSVTMSVLPGDTILHHSLKHTRNRPVGK
jgi:hypothetical protein